ncbi:MAG TPA: hypothetical protein VN837_09115, partial [Chloroflexota bacterium]|nr:hypothetical protein [Chloroflexota bacterium]
VAYQAIKAADPSAQVLIGSLNYNPTWLNDVFAADDADPDSVANHGYFDGLGLHSYGRSIGIYTMARQAEQVLTHYGMTNKLLVATELGVAVDDDPYVPATGLVATSAEASAYIIESFAAALAGGVDRMLLYRASDVGEPGYYGLLKYSGAARSTVVAYSLAVQYFANVQSARLIQSNPITRVELDEGTQQVTVIWNNAPRPATLSLYEKSANGGTLLDATGAPTQAIPDANGYYSITVPAATNNHGANSSDFIIGGGPYILIERGPFVPTQTVTPTNTASSTPTAAPSSTLSLPSATVTPTATTTPTATATPTATTIPTFAANAPRVYFTGGQTAGGSREMLNIANPLTTTTRLRLTVLGPSGPISTTDTLAPPHAFTDIDPGAASRPNQANGLTMQSDQPLAGSRVLLYGSAASVIAGTGAPSTHWYFPGLAATSPMTQVVTISNPGSEPAGITLTQLGDTGFLGAITGHVDAESQRSFVVASGGHDPDLAVVLTADTPVVAEYTAYLPGADPMTGAVGIRDLSHIWYSAEGYQTKGWGDHLVVLNPDPARPARVTMTAYSPSANRAGKPPPFLTTIIPARERATIDLSTLGISGSFSTVLTSTVPVAVNRTELFGQSESAAILSPGVERPSVEWVFPSGALGTAPAGGSLPVFAGAGEFLLLFNPSPTQVGQVSLTLYGSTGTIIRPAPLVLEPRQRLTIDLAKLGIPPGRNAAILQSTNGVPFVAEQSVYYNNGKNGFSGPGVPIG